MYNQINLIGRLGYDPELKNNNDFTICSFSLATSEYWKDKYGNKQEKTEWHRCVAFNNIADICSKYLKKGSLVFLSGKLQYREYEDKEGVNRKISEIVIKNVKLLDSKNNNDKKEQKPADDIPF